MNRASNGHQKVDYAYRVRTTHLSTALEGKGFFTNHYICFIASIGHFSGEFDDRLIWATFLVCPHHIMIRGPAFKSRIFDQYITEQLDPLGS
jgi:hypothetical protein